MSPRIKWIEGSEAPDKLAELFGSARAGSIGDVVPAIMQADAFDMHPPAVMDPDGVPGAVTRR